MNTDFQFHKYQKEVPSNLKAFMQSRDFNPRINKCPDIALEILGYIPILGTIKGAIDIYNIRKLDKKTDNWGKAKIIMNLFSFLFLPQIIYGVACVADAIHTKRQQNQAARAQLMDAISSGINASGEAAKSFENLANTQNKMRNEANDLFGNVTSIDKRTQSGQNQQTSLDNDESIKTIDLKQPTYPGKDASTNEIFNYIEESSNYLKDLSKESEAKTRAFNEQQQAKADECKRTQEAFKAQEEEEKQTRIKTIQDDIKNTTERLEALKKAGGPDKEMLAEAAKLSSNPETNNRMAQKEYSLKIRRLTQKLIELDDQLKTFS